MAGGFGVDHDLARREDHGIGDLGLGEGDFLDVPLELKQLAAAFHQRDVPGRAGLRQRRRDGEHGGP